MLAGVRCGYLMNDDLSPRRMMNLFYGYGEYTHCMAYFYCCVDVVKVSVGGHSALFMGLGGHYVSANHAWVCGGGGEEVDSLMVMDSARLWHCSGQMPPSYLRHFLYLKITICFHNVKFKFVCWRCKC